MLQNAPTTIAVVVQYGPIPELLDCLEHLLSAGKSLARVIVVDNGPGDAPRANEVTRYYPDVQYHWSAANLGFTGGCNAGIEIAKQGDFEQLLVVNNDVVPTIEAIELLEHTLSQDPTIGICGPMTYYPDASEPQYTGARINWARGKYKVNPEAWPHADGPPYDVDIVSGCAMMFRRDTLEKIGRFDERYFLYWEDVDMCARAREAGYRTVMVPGARMDHQLSASTGSGSPLFIYYETRNRLLFFHQHTTGRGRRHRLMTRLIFARTWMGLRHFFLVDRAKGRAYIAGVWDFLRGRLGRNRGIEG